MIRHNQKQEEVFTLFQQARRWMIIVVGMTVLLIGLALLILPGPAILVIPVGLAILAGEVVWARKFLNNIKERVGLKR